MRRIGLTLLVCALCALSLADCSRTGSQSALPAATVNATHQNAKTQVTFRIDVPKTGAAVDRRSAQYISPATTQMLINIEENSVEVSGYPKTVSLTPTSGGCTSTLASTNCQLTVSLSQGSGYTATLTTEDASGNALSAAQAIAFTVGTAAGTVAIALSGIPHTILVSSGAIAVHGSASAGFTLYGATAQPLIVTALDADGDTIVGPGAPTFMASPVSGTGWSANAPSNTAPNTLAITPPGTNGSGATFTVSASYYDSTCSDTGAVCSATFTIKNDIQTLFVANSGTSLVAAFVSPYTGAPEAQVGAGAGSVPSIALDAANNLFIAGNLSDEFAEYAPPYTGGDIADNSTGLNAPAALVIDSAGNLYAANRLNVTEYARPYTGSPTTIGGSGPVDFPVSMVIDSAGTIFVGNDGNNIVEAFAPPYTSATPMTTGSGNVTGMAVDPAGDVFLALSNANEVYEYTPPYTGSAIVISTGVSEPTAVTVDGSGNLFVANFGLNEVAEYAPPYTGPPVATISSFGGVQALAVDGAGNLIVGNYTTTMYVYAPPYTGAPTTMTTGISSPSSLLLTP